MAMKSTVNGDNGDDKAAFKSLIAKGKEQGYLTYDEINAVLPDEALSPDQLDETLVLFNDLDIDVLGDKKQPIASSAKAKRNRSKVSIDADPSVSEFGTVTDPVKMYLREMGMVTLLSREEEVEIAKKIESGEQEVLKALLDTTVGVKCILDLGNEIEAGVLRPRHVLRDLDEGDTCIDEELQIKNFIATIQSIREVDNAPEFCAKHKMFSFAFNDATNNYEIASREFQKIKRQLLHGLTNYGRPFIYAADGNYRNRGELFLKHRYEGVELKLDYARDTLANLQKLWGRPVHVETVIDDKANILSFDGTNHETKAK